MPRRSLLTLLVLLAAGFGAFIWASDWLTLEWIKAHRNDLVAFCQENMALGALAYCLAFVCAVALCLPGGGILAMVGGMLFGRWLGALLAASSAVIGGTIAFLVARYLLSAWAHARFARAFTVIDKGVERDGALYVFMMRLIIFVPFFVLNPAMGLTRIPLSSFVVASALGMAINAFLWANAGTMLGRIERLEDVFSWPVILSLTVIGVLPLLLKWLFLREK